MRPKRALQLLVGASLGGAWPLMPLLQGDELSKGLSSERHPQRMRFTLTILYNIILKITNYYLNKIYITHDIINFSHR
jgi:hypothetical protein